MRSLIFGILFLVTLGGIVFVSSILVLPPENEEIFKGGEVRILDSALDGGVEIVNDSILSLEKISKERQKAHFLVMNNSSGMAWLQIHEDRNEDGIFSENSDPLVEGTKINLPVLKFFPKTQYFFSEYPKWVGYNPTGSYFFPSNAENVVILLNRKGIDGQAKFELSRSGEKSIQSVIGSREVRTQH